MEKKSEEQDRGSGAEKVELEKRLDRNQQVAEDADTQGKGPGMPKDKNNHAE